MAEGEFWARQVVMRPELKNLDLRRRLKDWTRKPPNVSTISEVAGGPKQGTSARPQSSAYADKLRNELDRFGIRKGDLLFVHSSHASLAPLGLTPHQILAILQEQVGSTGTLAMPGSPILVKKNGKMMFDRARSPCKYGLVAEMFRRSPGVVRSPVPIANILAKGPLAEELTRDFFLFQSTKSVYGIGSPYADLGRLGAKVITLGLPASRALTLIHSAFDVLGPERVPIGGGFLSMGHVDMERDGKEIRVPNVLMQDSNGFAKYLVLEAFCAKAVREGVLQHFQGLPIRGSFADASQFLAWHLHVAERSGLPYWRFPKKR